MHYTDQRKSIDRRSQGYSRLHTLLDARQHTLKLYANLARHRPFPIRKISTANWSPLAKPSLTIRPAHTSSCIRNSPKALKTEKPSN